MPHPYVVCPDDAAKVWVSDCAANAVLRLDPQTEGLERFGFPRATASVPQLLGRHGEVWRPASGSEHLAVIRTA